MAIPDVEDAIMALQMPEANLQINELTRREGQELFDHHARRNLGISGEEFIRAYETGKFDDDLERPEIMRLIILLPFAK